MREISGKPFVYWTAKATNDCQMIDKVYIATDSSLIREKVEAFGMDKVETISRNAENVSDTASTESVMLEFAEKYMFDNIALIHATSPLFASDDWWGGFELFNQPDTDSILSAVPQKRFHWENDSDGLQGQSTTMYFTGREDRNLKDVLWRMERFTLKAGICC